MGLPRILRALDVHKAPPFPERGVLRCNAVRGD
jgi:hypothetical protein